jgi:hypothetical protein
VVEGRVETPDAEEQLLRHESRGRRTDPLVPLTHHGDPLLIHPGETTAPGGRGDLDAREAPDVGEASAEQEPILECGDAEARVEPFSMGGHAKSEPLGSFE